MGQQGKVPDYLEPYVFECHRHELRDFLHKEAGIPKVGQECKTNRL